MNSAAGGERLHQRIQAPKTAELIADQLRSQIVRGVLKAGDTLPTEIVLGKQFGVSRPTLREAFRILENESLILVRRGARGGVQVVSPDIAVAARYVGLLLQMSGTTLAELYEVRTVLEPAAVRMLTTRRTKADIQALSECIGELAELVATGTDDADLARWSAAAFRFHDLLMERAGNRVMTVLGGVLGEVVSSHMSRVVAHSPDIEEVHNQFKRTIRSFRKLVSLIEAKDPAAEEHWRSHMNSVAKKMLWGRFATESIVDLFS